MLTRRRLQFLASTAIVLSGGFAAVYFVFPDRLLHAYRLWQRNRAGFEHRIVRVEKWNIPYLDSNPLSDEPVVLLLHGFGDNKDNLIDFAAGLTGNYRVVVPDLPGFGETAVRAHGQYTPESYVRTILGLLDQLELSSVHVVGYSMGGMLATKVAAESPDRVRSLTLLAPAGIRGNRLSEFDQLVDAEEGSPLVYRDRQALERVLELNFNGPPKIPDFAVRALLIDGKRRADVWERVFTSMLANLQTGDLEQEIASLQMPVLMIAGEDDRIVDASAARRWQEINPGIEVAVLPDTSHALVHERCDDIRSLLFAFWARPANGQR